MKNVYYNEENAREFDLSYKMADMNEYTPEHCIARLRLRPTSCGKMAS